jgi:hypothetical protein
VQERRVRELLGHDLHGIHVAERGADDEVEALARETAEDLLRVGAFGDELDVGDVRVGDVLAEVLQALVSAWLTVIMWADRTMATLTALLHVGMQVLRGRDRGPRPP